MIVDETEDSAPELADEVGLAESDGELEVSTDESVGDEPITDSSDTTDAEGRPRNPDGTFAPKPQDGPQAEATPALEPTAPTADAAPEPFTFKSDKQSFSLDGAQYIKGEGVYIPESQMERTRQLLSNGVYLERNWQRQKQEWETRIAETEQRVAKDVIEREQRANALLAELDQVLSNPEALQTFYENLTVHGPALKERAKARILEERLREIEGKTTSQQQEQSQAQEAEDKVEAFRETVEQLKADPRFKVFSESDWQEYEQEMADLESVLFVRQEDGLYIDTDRMLKSAERRASLLSRITKQSTDLNKAASFNRLRSQHKPKPSEVREVVREEEAPKPKTRDEWRRQIGLT